MDEQKKVTVFSTPSCMYCNMLKAYFDEKGIIYEAIDVSENQEKAKYITEKTGQLGVPVTEIDETFVIGFDQPKIAELLNIV
jgi:glutaredoxin-like YruB-family protein